MYKFNAKCLHCVQSNIKTLFSMLSPISCSSADSICSSKTQVCTLKFEPGQIPIVEHWGEDLRKYLLLHFFMRRVGGQKHQKKHRIKKIAIPICHV